MYLLTGKWVLERKIGADGIAIVARYKRTLYRFPFLRRGEIRFQDDRLTDWPVDYKVVERV